MSDTKDNKEQKKNLHEGHRGRMRDKFIADGNLDGYAPHNILELLLFYALPRKDTNELAHQLIDHFGSFAGVLDASVEQLEQVPGIGENAAVLLSMLPYVFKRYDDDRRKSAKKTAGQSITDIITNRFIGETKEKVLLVGLNNKMEIVGEQFISSGHVDATTLNVRAMLDLLIRCNATAAVIAHNHPSGAAIPSNADIETTEEIINILRTINVKLLDHMIVGRDTTFSMAISDQTSDLFWE